MIAKCLMHDNIYIAYPSFFRYRWVVLGRKIIMGTLAYDDFNIKCAREFVREYEKHPFLYWFRLAKHIITNVYYRLTNKPLCCYYNIWPYVGVVDENHDR